MFKTYADLNLVEQAASGLKHHRKNILAVKPDPDNLQGIIIDQAAGKIRERIECECGRKVWPWVLVDCRHLPISQNWACDGCWTNWQRRKTPIDAGPDFIVSGSPSRDQRIAVRLAWERRWLKAHSATPQEIADFDASNHSARG